MGNFINKLCDSSDENTNNQPMNSKQLNKDNIKKLLQDHKQIIEDKETKEIQKYLAKSKILRKPSVELSKQSFEYLRLLGQGAFGKVYLVKKKLTGQRFALKTIKKKTVFEKSRKLMMAKLERDIMGQLNHPNIVKLFYAFQDDYDLCYVMEYAEGGTLTSYISQQEPLSEFSTRCCAIEIINALDYMHNTVKTIHRDLKPENILVGESGHLKLTDFGLSKCKLLQNVLRILIFRERNKQSLASWNSLLHCPRNSPT